MLPWILGSICYVRRWYYVVVLDFGFVVMNSDEYNYSTPGITDGSHEVIFRYTKQSGLSWVGQDSVDSIVITDYRELESTLVCLLQARGSRTSK